VKLLDRGKSSERLGAISPATIVDEAVPTRCCRSARKFFLAPRTYIYPEQTSRSHQVRIPPKVPGVAQAEGQVKGAVASEKDLTIARYDSLTADEITSKLTEGDDERVKQALSYERSHKNRAGVIKAGERERTTA